MTNLAPDLRINLSVTIFNVWDDKAVKTAVTGAFSMMALPGKVPVNGSWNFSPGVTDAIFIPAAALANNTDYLVRIQRAGIVYPEREYSLIRVGSLPRVKNVGFLEAESNASELGHIVVAFSEEIDRVKAAAAISIKQAGTGTTLPMKLSASGVNSALSFDVSPGIKMTQKLAIGIGTGVQTVTGVKLDGKYTGVAASGPLVFEAVPADHDPAANLQPWEPTLTF